MQKTLEGKVALIVGASKSIGREVALKYAELGAHVVISARTEKELESLYDEITENGGKSTLVKLDATDPEQVNLLSYEIANRFQKLDILVSCVNYIDRLTPLHQINIKNWQKSIDTNLSANFFLIRSFDPLLKNSSQANVFFANCDFAENAEPYWGNYTVAKMALESLVMAYENEVKNTNIKVKTIKLSPFKSASRKRVMPGEDQSDLKGAKDFVDLFII